MKNYFTLSKNKPKKVINPFRISSSNPKGIYKLKI